MNKLDFNILEYLAQGRNTISDGQTFFAHVRDRRAARACARKVFEAFLPEIQRARWFADAPEINAWRESLLGLAEDMEAVRNEARALL